MDGSGQHAPTQRNYHMFAALSSSSFRGQGWTCVALFSNYYVVYSMLVIILIAAWLLLLWLILQLSAIF